MNSCTFIAIPHVDMGVINLAVTKQNLQMYFVLTLFLEKDNFSTDFRDADFFSVPKVATFKDVPDLRKDL